MAAVGGFIGKRVECVPCFYRLTTPDGVTPDAFREIPGRFAVQREGSAPYTTVGARFVPFQDRDLFAFADALAHSGAARWETMGTLREGANVWGLAQLADGAFDVLPGDTHVPYLLFWNAHDGTSSIRVRYTTVRVVCANTAAAALSGKATEIRVRHTAGAYDALRAEADRVLGASVGAFGEQRDTLRALADRPFGAEGFATFVAQMLTREDDPGKALAAAGEAKGRSRTMLDRKADELCALFANRDRGNRGETRADAFNAVTDWVDHPTQRWIAQQRSRMGEWEARAVRFDRGTFGDGERQKRRALALLAKD
jgi:phage/plasmid-like protein (TIGR03299 family)